MDERDPRAAWQAEIERLHAVSTTVRTRQDAATEMLASSEEQLQWVEQRLRVLYEHLALPDPGVAPGASETPAAPVMPSRPAAPVASEAPISPGPAAPTAPVAPAWAAYASPRTPVSTPSRWSGEEGQRLLLALAGGLIVTLGVCFLVAIGISRGWITPEIRVIAGAVVSLLLGGTGIVLAEREDDRSGQPLSAVLLAAAVAAGYATLSASTALYGLVGDGLGIGVAVCYGLASIGVALRYRYEAPAMLAVVGALAAPILVGIDLSSAGLATVVAMMVVYGAAVAIAAVADWDRIAAISLFVALPQAGAYALATDTGAGVAATVLGALWVATMAGAVPRLWADAPQRLVTLTWTSASSIVVPLGWWAMHEQSPGTHADTWWIVAMGLAHLALAVAVFERNREQSLALATMAATLATIVAAICLSGPALLAALVGKALVAWALSGREPRLRLLAVALWGLALLIALAGPIAPGLAVDGVSGQAATDAAVAIAVLVVPLFALAAGLAGGARRELLATGTVGLLYAVPLLASGLLVVALWVVIVVAGVQLVLATTETADTGQVTLVGLAGLALAACHVVGFEIPVAAFADGVDDPLVAVGAVALLGSGLLGVYYDARARVWPLAALQGAAGLLVWLGAVLIVDGFQGVPATLEDGFTPRQQGQVLLSAYLAACGLGAVVLGLVRAWTPVRTFGLALFATAAAKITLVDLSTLDSTSRAFAFLAVGVFLLLGAFAYQRLARSAPPGET